MAQELIQQLASTPIEMIKQALTVTDALERYAGAKMLYRTGTSNRIQIRCPFHDDQNPSMTVYLDSNKCRCWSGSCIAHGQAYDQIDVVMMGQNLSRQEAIHTLLTDLHLSTGNNVQLAIVRAKAISEINDDCRMALKVVQDIMTNMDYIRSRLFIDVPHTPEAMAKAMSGDKADQLADMYNNDYMNLLILEDSLMNGDSKDKKNALEEVKALVRR